MKKLVVIALMCAIVSGGAFAAGSQQQESLDKFPSKAVNCMVAWAAGGGADMIVRALGEVFPKYANGQPLVVVNKGEAAGVPGILDFKQNATKDGYWVMQWNPAHTIKIHMDPVPFTGTEFPAVCRIMTSSSYFLVPANAKWKTIQEFVADAKANPNTITVGNAGTGGGNHLFALLFEKAAGIQLKHVPFAGGGPAITGTMTGDCMSVMASPPEGAPNVEAGQFRVLCVNNKTRYPNYPDVPTSIEAGINFALEGWRGLLAPAGIPEPIRQRLEDIFKKCIEDPQFIQRALSYNADPVFATGKEFDAILADADRQYEMIIKEAKLGNRY